MVGGNWEADVLRLAGSPKLGRVRAAAVLRTRQRAGALSGRGRG